MKTNQFGLEKGISRDYAESMNSNSIEPQLAKVQSEEQVRSWKEAETPIQLPTLRGGEEIQPGTLRGGEEIKPGTLCGGEEIQLGALHGGEQIKPITLHGGEEIQPGTLHGGEEIQPGTLHGGEEIQPGTLHGGEEIQPGTLHGGEEIQPGTLHGGEEIQPGTLHGGEEIQPSTLHGGEEIKPGTLCGSNESLIVGTLCANYSPATYRTRDGNALYKFQYVDIGGKFEIDITSQPLYGSRDSSLHATHRLSSSRGGYKICISAGHEPRTLEMARKISMEWAELTHTYINTGRTIDTQVAANASSNSSRNTQTSPNSGSSSTQRKGFWERLFG